MPKRRDDTHPAPDEARRIYAAQLLFDASVASFVAMTALPSAAVQEDARSRAHAHLDALLDAKRDMTLALLKTMGI